MRAAISFSCALLACSAVSPFPLAAGIPDPSASDCLVFVAQNPQTPACFSPLPGPIRLCPMGDYDVVGFDLRIRDSAGEACPGVDVQLFETTGATSLNMVGVGPIATADATGRAVLTLDRASGSGTVVACVEGIVFPSCRVEVRSPDVAGGAIPLQCPLPMAVASVVNPSDVTNPACGFIGKFGAVTPANQGWDLNCNGAVSAADILGYGLPPMGGVLQHFGHGGVLSARNTCP